MLARRSWGLGIRRPPTEQRFLKQPSPRGEGSGRAVNGGKGGKRTDCRRVTRRAYLPQTGMLAGWLSKGGFGRKKKVVCGLCDYTELIAKIDGAGCFISLGRSTTKEG